jgi:hypothetical protein
MWEPRRLTTLWASTACYRDRFFFTLLLLPLNSHEICSYFRSCLSQHIAKHPIRREEKCIRASFCWRFVVPKVQIRTSTRCGYQRVNLNRTVTLCSLGGEGVGVGVEWKTGAVRVSDPVIEQESLQSLNNWETTDRSLICVITSISDSTYGDFQLKIKWNSS